MKPQIIKQNIKQPQPLRHTHTHSLSLIIVGLFIVKITHLLLLLLLGGKSSKLVMMVVNERPMKRRIFANLYDFHTFPTTNTEDDQPFRVKMRAFWEKHAHLTLSHSVAMLLDFLESVVGASSLGDGRSEVVWVMVDRRWVLMKGREKQR